LGVQGCELVQVDHLVLGAELVLEAAQLRQPHVQRRLTTLEPCGHLVARLGALGATTGGLALRGLTATHAGLRGARPGRRAQVVHLQRAQPVGVLLLLSHVQSTSSTVTRCATVVTMPRTSGRSSLTTVSPMFFNPSERSVSRWFCLPPMADFFWVTFSWLMKPPLSSAPPCRSRRPRVPRPAHAGARSEPPGPAGARGGLPRPPAAPATAER